MTGTNVAEQGSTSLIRKFAAKFSIEPERMMTTLKRTAFKQSDNVQITNEQMAALIVVADQYNLNPWTREIYAYPDKGGIVPVVGVDGWARIINEHPQFDGLDFNYSDDNVKGEEHKDAPEWIEVSIYRKDRSHPVTVREYFDEVYRKPFVKNGKVLPGPWQTHTRRMMRHKVLIQGARVAFGFVGVYDQDEAERILEGDFTVNEPTETKTEPQSQTDRVKSALGVGRDTAADDGKTEAKSEEKETS